MPLMKIFEAEIYDSNEREQGGKSTVKNMKNSMRLDGNDTSFADQTCMYVCSVEHVCKCKEMNTNKCETGESLMPNVRDIYSGGSKK